MCKICDRQARDGPVHILFECEYLSDIRTGPWSDLILCMPTALSDHMTSLNNRDKYAFIISGLHCSKYIDEWKDILRNIAIFAHVLYNERKSIYEALEDRI